MSGFKILVLATAAMTVASVAAPAAAVVFTFGTYGQVNGAKTLRWVNGTGEGQTTSSNVGGRIFTTATGSASGAGLAPGSTAVQFSFFQNPLSDTIFNAPATFTLLGTSSSATTLGGPNTAGTGITQGGIDGSFSLISAVPFLQSCAAPCTNLLSASFTNGQLTGSIGGSTASLQLNSGAGGTLLFTSDFLDFDLTSLRDVSFSLSGLSNPISVATGKSLQSTRGVAGASFSSDPAPLVNGVPEPQVWALLVAGFGLVGFSLRRRSTRFASVAA
jgi:hypothetical protein